MTSASELFYNRRSRYNNRSSPHHDLGFDSLCPPDRIYNRRHHNHHHHQNDAAAACDLLIRRSPHTRRLRNPLPNPIQERGTAIGPEQGAQTGSSNGPGATRNTLSGNERLPGAVVLARERLVERLRGMPPSGTRRGRALHIYRSGRTLGDDMGPADEWDWATDILAGRSASGSAATVLSSQIERMELLQESNKKPPGLTEEVLDCLSLELFNSKEMGVDGLVSRASRDCSICLESFMDGEELICLPCAHRFHACCLGPWVRIRGDCPYCRRVIVVNSQTAKTSI